MIREVKALLSMGYRDVKWALTTPIKGTRPHVHSYITDPCKKAGKWGLIAAGVLVGGYAVSTLFRSGRRVDENALPHAPAVTNDELQREYMKGAQTGERIGAQSTIQAMQQRAIAEEAEKRAATHSPARNLANDVLARSETRAAGHSL